MSRIFCAIAVVMCFSAVRAAADDLLSILDQAIASDPRVRISELQVEVNRARDDQAFGRMLPSISAGAQLTDIDRTELDVAARGDCRPTPPATDVDCKDSYDGKRYSLSARQMLYNREMIKNRKRTRNLVRQAEYEHDDALASLMLDVGEKYLTALGNEDNLELVRAEKDSVLKRLEQYEELYEKRLIKITDLLDARARRDEIIADEIQVESNVLVSKEQLRSLTGAPVGDLTPLSPDAQFPPLEGTMDYWIDASRSYSPNLLARQKAVDAARAGLEQARASHWPTLDLQLSYLDSDTGYENALVNRNQTSAVALVFNVPLVNGGIGVARTNEARSQLNLEKMRREEALREVERSVKEAYVTANSNQRRIDAGRAQMESANKAYEAMEKSFQYGTVTVIDVIEALERKFEANRDLLQAKYAYLLSWLRLAYYAGELDKRQMLIINTMLET